MDEKEPLRCWDCLNCDENGEAETYWTRETVGPLLCVVCGSELVLRKLEGDFGEQEA